MEYRYYIAYDTEFPVWHEVVKSEFVRQERAAGFHNTMGQPNEPATGGFSGGGILGRVRSERNPVNTGSVEVPREGEYLVRNGEVHSVFESEVTDLEEDYLGWQIWTNRKGE